MEYKKIIIITDSKVLESWCSEELNVDFSLSCISFKDCKFSEMENEFFLFEGADAVLVDYSVEKEKCIVELYDLLCEALLYRQIKFIILYDSYSCKTSRLNCLFRKARLFNLVSPAYSLRKMLESSKDLQVNAIKAIDKSSYGSVRSARSFEEELKIVAGYDECVLLLGESGSGKTWAARKIHQYSKRCKEGFYSVNVAEFNPNLIEGNLFGVSSGAYTGAVVQKGWFEQANHGTLLLDEIGELPFSLQAKLLSVIEGRVYKRLGSTKECHFDEKLIFASNRNLEECVRNHTFRSDLFYRINCLTVYVPPLRSHKDDIPSLAQQFSVKHKKILSQNAIEKLCSYSWPGNIRELENVVKRACIFSRKELVTADDILLSHSV